MKYGGYIIEYTSTDNTHIDHTDDIFCRVYRQPEGTSETEMLNSFIVTGGEIHDYGSAEAAITAYMRRNYPSNDEQDIQEYRRLQKRQKEVQHQVEELIKHLLARHGGNITSHPIADEYGGCDYPVTMLFHGYRGSQNINITGIYLDKAGRLKACGIDDYDGTFEQALEIHPEHYEGTLDFLAFALGIRPTES